MELLGIGSSLLIFAGLCLIFWLQRKSPTTQSPAKEDRFVDDVRVILKEYYPDVEFAYNSETDTLAPTDETLEGSRVFLGNLRLRTQDMSQSDREAFMRSFLGHVSQETEITPEILRKNLYMRNRTPEEFSNRQIILAGDKTDGESFEPIIIAKGEMLFEPVLDFDNAIQPMNVKIMREHGFAFDDFIQMAGQNLLRATPEQTDAHWELIERDIWISKLSDDYDAARLFLFPGQLTLPVGGPLIAYAPSHSVCLVTSNTDSDTLAQMIELGNQSAETHRPLSRALWQQTDTGWSRMNSEDRNSVDGRAYLMEMLAAHDDQADTLEQYFAKIQQDIHVAKIIARSQEVPDSKPIIKTMSVFIGKGSYLPKTDFVVLALDSHLKEGDDMLEVAWDSFVEIIGEENLPVHPDYRPRRYMYMQDLPQDKIAALRASATAF